MNHRAQGEELLDSWLALTGEGPATNDLITLPVLSGSMLPQMPVNSIIHIKRMSIHGCKTGHVVVYREGDRLVAHRLLWSFGLGSAQFCFEKGDANKRGGWIRGHQVLGLVVAVSSNPECQPPQTATPMTRQPELAAKSLRADFIDRTLAWPRRIKHWIFR